MDFALLRWRKMRFTHIGRSTGSSWAVATSIQTRKNVRVLSKHVKTCFMWFVFWWGELVRSESDVTGHPLEGYSGYSIQWWYNTYIYICIYIYIWYTMVTWCYMRQRWKPVLGIVGVPFDPETLSMAFWDFPFFGPSGRFPPFGKLGWNLGLSENRLLWISTITITYYHYPGLSPLIMSWVYHGIPHF